MPIITQAGLTALRGLKYGNDQPGGGSSGEPYITTKLPPPYQQQVPSTTIWNSDNGLIRGGFAGATLASARDTLRIGKFLVDPPRGPLFIAKQVGLQLSNPQLETRTDAVGQLLGKIGPTRIYNLGINTLAQIPITAFGGHITRHGLLPVLNEGQLYKNVVVANDGFGSNGANNRLVLLKNKLVAAGNNTTVNINQYVSGPGSVDGIGQTTIKRYYNTLGNQQYNQYGGGRRVLPIDASLPGFTANLVDTGTARVVSLSNIANRFRRPVPNIDYFLAQGVSEEYFDFNRGEIEAYNNIITGSLNSKPSQIDQNVINYSAGGKLYSTLRNAINQQTGSFAIGTANIVKANNDEVGPGTINPQGTLTAPITFAFKGFSQYKPTVGQYAKTGLPLGGINPFNIEDRLGLSSTKVSGKKDQINLTPLFQSEDPPGTNIKISNGPSFNVRDLIKFRIEAVDGNTPSYSTWMVFRAYLTDISDNPNPTWNTVNYVGRGEPFYIYKGFERSVSFTFQVAAMSEEEMKPMWQKLNYLYSNTMPDYSGNVMRGPFMKLTIGNYMFRQPGIIKNLTYTIDNKSPWEISIDDPERKAIGGNPMYELPHVMTVQMTFAPVHDFLPRKFPDYFEGDWKNLPAFVVDRDDDNNNKWLTDIFQFSVNDKGGGGIPIGNPT
jgi:hypothetical protein